MSEETIFREVDEELRRDRLRHGWRRYGFYVIGAAVLVVLVVAANEGWSWWQGSNAARSSDQFYAALDAEDGGDIAAAAKGLDAVIAQGTGQYPDLARFKQASLLARQGKTADAQAAYDALANSESNSRLKELALLFAANLLVDKGDVNGVKSRIEGLLTPDDPLRNAASETIGLVEYKAGDLNGARDSFAAVLADPQVSSDTRGRMQLYLGQLVAQGATLPGAGDAMAAPASPAPAAATGSSPAPAAVPAASSVSPSAAADATTPVGVESAQPSVPDAALDMATPAPAATAPPAAVPDSSIPLLSTGAGLPSAPSADTSPAAAGTVSQPAAAAAPAASTTPPSVAPAATPPAPATPTSK